MISKNIPVKLFSLRSKPAEAEDGHDNYLDLFLRPCKPKPKVIYLWFKLSTPPRSHLLLVLAWDWLFGVYVRHPKYRRLLKTATVASHGGHEKQANAKVDVFLVHSVAPLIAMTPNETCRLLRLRDVAPPFVALPRACNNFTTLRNPGVCPVFG